MSPGLRTLQRETSVDEVSLTGEGVPEVLVGAGCCQSAAYYAWHTEALRLYYEPLVQLTPT